MKHRRKKITCWFAVMLVLLMTVTSISAYGQETTQTETNDSGNAGKNVNTVQSSESELQKDTEDSSLKKASNTKVSVNTNYYNKTMERKLILRFLLAAEDMFSRRSGYQKVMHIVGNRLICFVS